MEKKLYELRISEDLEHAVPPLTQTEISMLRESILENGCEMPLIVWGDTIVDGHNRYKICQEYGIPFAVEHVNFDDMTDAKIWIIKNQIGRRNLTPFQRCEMVLPLEAELKAEAKKRQGRRNLDPSERIGSREILANMAGVSHGSLSKAKAIVEAGDEETKRRLRSGEISIHYAYSTITGDCKVKPKPPIDVIRNKINTLISELDSGFIDRGTVISALTEVSELLEGR